MFPGPNRAKPVRYMNMTTYIMIPFPRKEEDQAVLFYRNKMGFDEIEGDFLIDSSNPTLRLRLRIYVSPSDVGKLKAGITRPI